MKPSPQRRIASRKLLSVLALAPALLCSCKRLTEPGEARSSPGAPDLAKLTVDTPSHDFGQATQYDRLRHTFALQNHSSRAIELHSVQAGHSCTSPQWPKTLAPGQRGELDVICEPKTYGRFYDRIVIHSDAPTNEQSPLELKAHLTPAAVFDRELVTVQVPFGGTAIEEVRLTGARALSARLALKKEQQSDLVRLEMLQQEPLKPPGLRLRFQATQVGTHTGELVVSTGLAMPTEARLLYTFRVQGTLQVEPLPVYMNLREADLKATTIDVRSSQSGFRVVSVEVAEGPFAASFDRGEDAQHYRLKIFTDERRLNDETRGTLGKLLLRTNDRTEQLKEIPILAFGKLMRSEPEDATSGLR